MLCNEIIELLEYNYNQIDFIDKPVDLGFDCPLDLYCTYTRDQILSALDYLSPSSVQAGTFFLADKRLIFILSLLTKARKTTPQRQCTTIILSIASCSIGKVREQRLIQVIQVQGISIISQWVSRNCCLYVKEK